MSTEIKRILKNNEWEGIRNSNTPSASNPIATLSDITAGVPNGNLLVSGGAAYSGTGLDFDVTALEYLIAGVTYNTAPTTVTLNNGDPVNPRFDAIVADDTSTVLVVEGTPAATPITPAISEDQVLVQYVLVGANATTPAITTENIYREGTGFDWTPGESCALSNCPTADFTSTTPTPFEGNECTLITFSDYSTGRYIKYTTSAPVNRDAFSILTFRIWLTEDLTLLDGGAGRQPFVRLMSGGGALLGSIYLTAWGLQRNVINTWQLISIPMAAFASSPLATTIGEFRIHLVETSTPTVPSTQIAIDDVKLQSGLGAPIQGLQSIDIQENGVTIDATSRLNFKDTDTTSVNVTSDVLNDRLDIEVDRPFEVEDDGANIEPTISGINFTGAGVSVSTPGGPNPKVTVNIPGGGGGSTGVNISSTQWSKTSPLTSLAPGNVANGLTFFRDDLYASELTLGGVTGSGYTTANGVATTTTGSGTGMTVDIVANGSGDVTSVTINNPGFGYTLNDVITIVQGGTASDDETATITDLASDKSLPSVAALTIDNPGTGYSTGTAIEVTGGTGVGLLVNIDSVGGSGEITAVSIEDKGDRYTDGDSVTVQAGNNDATLTLTAYEAGTTVYDEYNIAYGISIVLDVANTNGTANINIDGTDYLLTFTTDNFTSATNWEAAYGDTLRALNIRPFVLGSGSDGRIRFCAPRAILKDITISTVSGDITGARVQEFVGGDVPAPDHILIPYVGKPYFGKRIQHYIRVNFNVNTGAVKYANLQLRRYANDSVIGSSIPVQRYAVAGITGQQHVFETYTASPTDSFVLGGFYFALDNLSNDTWEIEGSAGILVQNIFEADQTLP